MSEETQSSGPLEITVNLGAVDTSRPVPDAGTYHVKVAKLEVKPNKAGTGTNLVATLSWINPCLGVRNSFGVQPQINAGYTQMENLPMQKGEKDSDFWAQKLAMFYDACMGTDDTTRPHTVNYGLCLGKELFVNGTPKEDDFGLKFNIKKMSPVRLG